MLIFSFINPFLKGVQKGARFVFGNVRAETIIYNPPLGQSQNL